MTGWKEVNIGSLGEVITGNTPPTVDREYYGGHYPFIKPTDMDLDRRRVTKWEENFTEKAFKKYKNCYIPVGATGVVTIGTVGEKIFQADRNCFTNQSVNVVIPNSEYDPDFVYYLLKLNLPKVSAANPGTASGRHHVSKSNFCAINLSVPKNKLVQTKIGQILSAYDDLIENNLNRIKLLEELAQRTFEEWFVKFRVNGETLEIDEMTGLPVNWKIKRLDEVLHIKNGRAYKLGEGELRIPIFGSNGIIGLLSKSNSENALVIGRVGAYCGSIFYCRTKFWATDNTIIVQEKDKSFSNEYAYFVLTNLNLRRLAGGSAQPLLTQTTINQILVNAPTESLVHAFTDFCSPIFKQIDVLTTQNLSLKESRDILLPRLINGIINIAVTETEPTAKIIQLDAPTRKQTTPQFKEAILISLLTLKFGSEKYPLGRMRYTKLSYLFHRHADNQIKDYLRKAAGPYNPKTKYGGPEKIAHDNGYVIDYKNGQLTGFIAGPNIENAKLYFESYWDREYLTWLEAQFKYKSNDDLELFATVDNSLIELNKNNEPFTVETVKNILKKEPEWKAKLKREIFNDINIQRAITYLPTIFQY
ncbi:MAG: restriction endonuclease subunit S [Sphingobacteriales bacterium]|nr:MAG: restriction endonuclease subunit S [Sphingobacteriales bacterium]